MVVFWQKWLYSGKVVVFGQSCCNRAKFVVFGKIVVFWKVVVFGEKWLFLVKSGFIRAKVVVIEKICCIRAMWL